MAKTTKDNHYQPQGIPIQQSAWHERWVARQSKLNDQQASCMHMHYTVYGGTFGPYAVCCHCDKRLDTIPASWQNKEVGNA